MNLSFLDLKKIAGPPKGPNKIFYVCSYGGSGSTMLTEYLSHFGDAKHIHSRIPPIQLTRVGASRNNQRHYFEWFNDEWIPNDELKQYKVIYIYRNPVNAILSFANKNPRQHLKNIQVKNTNIKMKDIMTSQMDLYGLNEFHRNYTTPNKNRNYEIICIKYEDLFSNIENLNHILGIENRPHLYPVRRENHAKEKKYPLFYNKLSLSLTDIYKPLIEDMNQMPSIKIV